VLFPAAVHLRKFSRAFTFFLFATFPFLISSFLSLLPLSLSTSLSQPVNNIRVDPTGGDAPIFSVTDSAFSRRSYVEDVFVSTCFRLGSILASSGKFYPNFS
jgi:hypothetical protein